MSELGIKAGRPASRQGRKSKRRVLRRSSGGQSARKVPSQITAEEFEERYVDVPFCELERGEVIHLTAGGWNHSAITYNVASLLGQWARKTKRGRILTNEAGLITERHPDTVRGVDVMYFSYVRVAKGKAPDGYAERAPELAVEIVGKKQGWKKMVGKAAEYMAMGTERVWIVDPKKRTLHVFRDDQEPEKYEGNAIIRDEAVLPGFSCRLNEFFED